MKRVWGIAYARFDAGQVFLSRDPADAPVRRSVAFGSVKEARQWCIRKRWRLWWESYPNGLSGPDRLTERAAADG